MYEITNFFLAIYGFFIFTLIYFVCAYEIRGQLGEVNFLFLQKMPLAAEPSGVCVCVCVKQRERGFVLCNSLVYPRLALNSLYT